MNARTCVRANVSSVSHCGLDAAATTGIFCIGQWLLFVAGDSPGGDGLTREGVTAFRLLPHFETKALALAGLILNQPAHQPDPMMDNAADLERWLQMPVLRLPHGSGSRIEVWRQEAALLAPLADAWFAEEIEKLC